MTGKQEIDFLRKIVDLLKERGLDASLDYPGYIGVVKEGKSFAFGTAGGDWGWNDEDGRLAGSLGVSGQSRNAKTIADRIAEVMRQSTFEFMGDSPVMANIKKEAIEAAEKFQLRANASRIKKAALDAVAAHEKKAAPPEDEQNHNPYEGKEYKDNYSHEDGTPDMGLSGAEPEPEPTEVERTAPATDPAPAPVPPVQPPAGDAVTPPAPVEINEENEEKSGDSGEVAVRASVEAQIDDPDTIEAVMEFLKAEDYMDAHSLEIKEGVWGWREAANFATIEIGSKEYMIAPSEEAAEAFAKAMVKQQLNDEPELFTQDWLEGYIDEERLRGALEPDVEEDIRNNPDSYGWEPGTVKDEEIARYDGEGNEDEDGEYDENGDLIEDADETEPSDDWIEKKVGEVLRDPMAYLRDIYGDETMKHAMNIAGINVEEAADDAVSADGAGHFLSSYDGNMNDLPSGGVWWRHN